MSWVMSCLVLFCSARNQETRNNSILHTLSYSAWQHKKLVRLVLFLAHIYSSGSPFFFSHLIQITIHPHSHSNFFFTFLNQKKHTLPLPYSKQLITYDKYPLSLNTASIIMKFTLSVAVLALAASQAMAVVPIPIKGCTKQVVVLRKSPFSLHLRSSPLIDANTEKKMVPEICTRHLTHKISISNSH